MKNLAMEMNSLEEALERWFLELNFRNILDENQSEQIPVADSLSRITAEPIFAVHPSPSFYAASVDGIAVLSSITFGVAPHNPLSLTLGKDAKFVDTGSIIPEGMDAVVPIEKVKFLSIDKVQITKFCAPWENVRPLGEEVAAREIIVPAHHTIRPFDVAAMYMGGVSSVNVVKKPKVAILPIGSSLVPAGSEPEEGKVIETSSQFLGKIIEQLGCESVVLDIIPETIEEIAKASAKTIPDIDLMVVIAGPSLGTRPIAEIISMLGELIAYGVQVKPGMSSCFGVVDNVPVIGLPGYALSTFIIFELFGMPVISKKLGLKQAKRRTINAYLSQNIHSPSGVDEFIRVSLGVVEDLIIAAPISRGAHILMSLVRADGTVRIKADKNELKAGDSIEVELLRPDMDINKKVLISGTHDLCFDILRNELQRKYADVSLFSSNVGSLRGIMALASGYAHIASAHVFDDETGEYNIPFVKKFLQDMPLIVVNVFHRKLGLIVAKGNPKNILSFDDLVRPDVKIINRIRGAGTRSVFDYHLSNMGIDPNKINGYADEAHTHLNLASAIASGNADAGLGIVEAAKATGLDFVPLIPERLDFVVPKKFLNYYPVRSFLHVINSDEFKRDIEALGGYDASSTGKVLFER